MNNLRLPLLSFLLFCALLVGAARPNNAIRRQPDAPEIASERDRSPMDLILTADGKRALTANATADSVSLVDIAAGTVLAEAKVGAHPFCVALSRDGALAIVSNQEGNSVSLLDVLRDGLHVRATLPVGDEPRGVAFAPDGKQAFVALSGEDSVAVVDVPARKVTAHLLVGVEPWHLALTPDGKRLAVGNARSQDMSVIDVAARRVAYTVKLRGHNVRHVAVSPDGQWAYMPHIAERGRATTKENIDQGWIVGNRLSRVPLSEDGPRESIALDPRGEAFGDVDGVAMAPDGNTIAVTAGGTHELLLLRLPLQFFAYGGPPDAASPDLVHDLLHFRRIPLGGRPLGVQFTPDGKTLVVANYLSNSLQIVGVDDAKVEKTIALGGPPTPSLTRRGEAVFLDASRSFHQWYSCNTCHVEGNTNGSVYDTFNDGSYGTLKKVLSLRGVTQTPPWTWHGWQTDLRTLCHKSLTETMEGPEPSDADLDALMAYLGTLKFRPNPRRNAAGAQRAAAERGEAIFQAKGCNTCHAAPDYTTPKVYIVGLEAPEDVYKGFNPPSLHGVYRRSPYLHTGQAKTLEEVLTTYHRSSLLTGKPDPTPAELADLIAFLKTL